MLGKMNRILATVLVLVLSIGMFIMPAQAAADYTPEIRVPVTVNLSGALPAAAETFFIRVEAKDPTYPMPSGAENGIYTLPVSASANEDGTPGKVASGTISIEYNKLGIYTYTVKQLTPANTDCYADGKEYLMTVWVTNTAEYDGFETSVRVDEIDKAGNKVREKCDLQFANRYAEPDIVDLVAIKTMDRKTPKDGAFTFKLADGEGDLVEYVKNEGQDVVFTPIVCDKVGTFTYVISEVHGINPKISYDKTKYTVTIVVEKDENGDYQAEVSFKKGDKDYTGTPAFANFTKTSNPITGDMFRMGLWVSLLVISFAALVVLIFFWFKKRKN